MNVDCVLVLRLFLVTKTRDLSGCGHQVSFYSDSSRSKCAFKFCLFCYCKILYGDWVGMCEWLLIVLISLESYLCIHIPSFCIAFVFFSIVPSTARCWCMAVAYRNVDNTHAMASAYGIAFACVLFLFFFWCVWQIKQTEDPSREKQYCNSVLGWPFMQYVKLQDKLKKLSVQWTWDFETRSFWPSHSVCYFMRTRCVIMLNSN